MPHNMQPTLTCLDALVARDQFTGSISRGRSFLAQKNLSLDNGISHETAIWKGSHNPTERGLTITMVINHLQVLG